ncbi:MAG: hypothetical protein ABIQ95_11385, partial [Bdellovibrionia bacterium]
MKSSLIKAVVVCGLIISDVSFPHKVCADSSSQVASFASLSFELRSAIYSELLKQDETALIALSRISRAFQRDIRSFGYHTEQVLISSLEQLENDFPRT